MTVYVNPTTCTGCGLCTDICSETFEMGDDHVAHVARLPDSDHESCALTASHDCPVEAIVVH